MQPSTSFTGFEASLTTMLNEFSSRDSNPQSTQQSSWSQPVDDERLQDPPNFPTTYENLPNPGGAPSTVQVHVPICNLNLTE